MLLTGTYHRTLDDKFRFAMPKRLRTRLEAMAESEVYLTPNLDGSLAIYPATVFDQLGEKFSQATPAAQDVRTFSRLFYAQAEHVELDGQGRIRIPAELAQLAGLDKEVVLLGVGPHLEIWDRQAWETFRGVHQPQFDELAERALGAIHPSAGPTAPEPIPFKSPAPR